LSQNSKYLWTKIERELVGTVITLKGYVKRQNEILEKEGLYISEMKNTASKDEKGDISNAQGMLLNYKKVFTLSIFISL